MSEELKPCPWCQKVSLVDRDSDADGYTYEMASCSTPKCVGAEIYVSKKEWNTRSTPTFTQEDVEKAAVAFVNALAAEDGVHHSDDITSIGLDGYFDFQSAIEAALNAVGKIED